MAPTSAPFGRVVVSGLAHLDAPVVVSSRDIDGRLAAPMERFGMQPGVLEELAGIVERRYWEEGTQPSAVAARAAERLLERGAVGRSEIGALVNTSVCRDYVEPSTACIVHAKLGLSPEAVNFDVANACLGFLNGMDLVATMIEAGQIDHGLVVDGEGSRFTVETTIDRLNDPACDRETFRDSFASLTLGSGAAAMLLSRADLVEDGHLYRGAAYRAATEHNHLCIGQYDDMRTDTKGLLTAGLSLAKELYPEAAETFDLGDDEAHRYIVHQISQVHTTMLCDLLDLDAGKMPLIYPRFGNIGPAGVPITLSKEQDAGNLSSGDRVVLLGVGSGLNAAVGEIVW
ncbi:3-oxoacyl-ACP synthase III [soil metagenome]